MLYSYINFFIYKLSIFIIRPSRESTSVIYIVLVVIRIPPVATDILITLSTDTLSLDHLNSLYFDLNQEIKINIILEK